MSEKVVVEVSGIRLEEDSETPIMLLQDPKTFRFLPIWIGTIEAVSIAYAQEGYVHPRPQTHDLLIDIVESLNASISEVCITDIKEKTYFAEITLNTLEGNVTLSSRPSDAIALAIRSDSKITVDNELFNSNSIILIEENNEEIQEFKQFIDEDIPANNAGGAGIAGFTPDTMGVPVKAQRRYQDMNKKDQANLKLQVNGIRS